MLHAGTVPSPSLDPIVQKLLETDFCLVKEHRDRLAHRWGIEISTDLAHRNVTRLVRRGALYILVRSSANSLAEIQPNLI